MVPNPHLFSAEELALVMKYRGGPIVLIGRKVKSLPPADFEFRDVYPPNELWCGVYHAKSDFVKDTVKIVKDGAEIPLGDVANLTAPHSYWTHLTYRKVSQSFVKACADTLQKASQAITVTSDGNSVAVMPVVQENGRLRIAIKNRSHTYMRPLIDVGKPVKSVNVLTSFPSVTIHPKGSTFSVRVPGRGIIVVEVVTQEDK